MSYVAPALRKKVKVEITSLAPENFPEFGSTCKRTVNQNFLARVLKGEEERITQQKESIYDPSKISNLTHSQLRNEGWEVLQLGNPLSWFIDWNDRLVTGRKPVVPSSINMLTTLSEGGQSTSMILGHQSSYRNPNSESSDYPYRAVVERARATKPVAVEDSEYESEEDYAEDEIDVEDE